MEFNKNEIDLDKYIQGELTENELKAFEDLLEKDEALQKQVEFNRYTDAVLHQKLASKEVAEEIETKLKPILAEFSNKYFTEEAIKELESNADTVHTKENKAKPSIIKRLFPFTIIAAAAVMLLFLFLPNKQNQLYANYYQAEKTISTQGKPNNQTDLDKGINQYENKKYKDAITFFDKYPDNPYALLFKGNAQMELNQMGKAIQTFQLLTAQHADFADKANWYLALCYLKKGEEELSKTTLKRISPNEKECYDKAQQLLKEL